VSIFIHKNVKPIAKVGTICMAISSIPMAMIGVYPTFTPNEENISKWRQFQNWLIGHHSAQTLTENISNHLHNVSSLIAFTLLLVGIFIVSASFLKDVDLKRIGRTGMSIFPLMIILLIPTYIGSFYNGSWQRMAFLLPFFWILYSSRTLRKDFAHDPVENPVCRRVCPSPS